jgi:hypothetical protein
MGGLIMDNEKLVYTVSRIDKVKEYEDCYEITFDKCVCCILYKKHRIIPEVGQLLEVYGAFGQTIQGICINGKTAFFKGEVQLNNERQLWLQKEEEKERKNFKVNKNKLDAEYENLPDVFKKRIDILRQNNKLFRQKHEAYEMSCCIDAVKIAKELKTVEEYNKFIALDWDKQIKRVKDLYDGHSYNSFGCACQLAYYYITDPDYIYKSHGALCPLVGCKDYGCYISTKEINESSKT